VTLVPISGRDLDAYRENGVILLKGFFSEREIEAIHADAKHVFGLQLVERGILHTEDVSDEEFAEGMFELFARDVTAITNCGKQAQHLISLHRLSLDGRVLEVLRALGLDFPIISTRPVLYFNSPRLATKEVYWKVPLHQDWRSMQGSLDSVFVWVPLVDIDRALGALEVIPGSHRRGLLPAEVVDSFGEVRKTEVEAGSLAAVEVKRGDAFFCSTFLLHQSGTNVTRSVRWSCHFRYNNLYERTFIERGFPHPYVYAPQDSLITPGFPSADAVAAVFAKTDPDEDAR
jgi:phytanoyl-CoA hydroxylase